MFQITAKTSLLALLGQPVNHSLSPVMHNAALQKMGLDWCYVAIPCETNNLATITNALKLMNCNGINITIPHKQNILNCCSEITDKAKSIQAVNTLILNQNKDWIGTNTDIDGFLAPLRKINTYQKNALIIGSGGSARAVAAGLKKLNLKQIITIGRTQKSLDNFLIDVNKNNHEISHKEMIIKGIINDKKNYMDIIEDSQIIINTTPVGMHQLSRNECINIPLGERTWEALNKGTILYDLIYNPLPTKWLELGIKKGCIAIDGLEMLVEQGAESLRLWSGFNDIPIDTMRLSAKRALIE